MNIEAYTPGHTDNATDFMSKRSVETHGQFFLRYLTPGVSVLDAGCGPGSITSSIAPLIAPGSIVGIDFGASQIERAASNASRAGIHNAEFRTADCYSLPYDRGTFDRVFSHALMEHLSDPLRAMKELHRVLKPGGFIGVCSPDWGGFLLAPPSADVAAAVTAYTNLQASNGGDVQVGRRLGAYMAEAGFADVRMSARYECYPSLTLIGEYLALQLDRAADSRSAKAFRDWSRSEGGMFAQCWVSSVARKQ